MHIQQAVEITFLYNVYNQTMRFDVKNWSSMKLIIFASIWIHYWLKASFIHAIDFLVEIHHSNFHLHHLYLLRFLSRSRDPEKPVVHKNIFIPYIIFNNREVLQLHILLLRPAYSNIAAAHFAPNRSVRRHGAAGRLLTHEWESRACVENWRLLH